MWIVMVNASFNAAAHDRKSPLPFHIPTLVEVRVQMFHYVTRSYDLHKVVEGFHLTVFPSPSELVLVEPVSYQ